MSAPLDTSDMCQACGKAIPPMLRADALCVRCRYGGTRKPAEPEEQSECEVATETIPEPPATERFEDRLLGEGFSLEAAARAAELFDEMLEEEIARRTLRRDAEGLRMMLARLDGTDLYKSPVGKAFRRVAMGADGRTLEQDAEEVGCTKQALHYHVSRIKTALSI